jgi:uncharacterized membrane protein
VIRAALGVGSVIAEERPEKAQATFSSQQAAERAADQVRTALGDRAEVKTIAPDDAHLAQKVEPERKRVWSTLVKAHVRFSIAGLLIGLVATILLALLGITFVADSLGLALIFGGGLGLFLGLLFGGLISLRPDEAAIAALASVGGRGSSKLGGKGRFRLCDGRVTLWPTILPN